MTTTKTQECSTAGCANQAAFTTRTKPAWCTSCIDDLLREGGLEPAGPFVGPRGWRLTKCLACGVQAHYRLEYTVEKNADGEKTCRACYWRDWAAESRNKPWREFDRIILDLLREHTPEQILEVVGASDTEASTDIRSATTTRVREFLESGWWPLDRITSHLHDHGFDFIANTVEVNDGNDPVVARCQVCGTIRAARMGDFGFGCVCSRNSRSSHPASPRVGRVLLPESESPALDWWDHERNDEAMLATVTVRALRTCHWLCPECGLRFEAKTNDMAARPSCPDCAAGRREKWNEEYARWKVTSVADVPELMAAWADDDDPREVMVGDAGPLRRFRCLNGHHPRIGPLRFLQSGCPHCRGAQTAQENKQWLADTLPEIASQWHPTRNGRLTPQNVVWDSKRTVWWRADCCGNQWQESVRDRDKYARTRCRPCRTILGSLAWHDPGLAAEWSPTNRLSPWQVRPHGATDFVPEWICATNPAHVWRAPLSDRTDGADCPECREVGKSRVELAHHAAAVEVFGAARSGVSLRDDAFTSRRSWSADISADVDGYTLVIEYDGAYWHAAPAKVLVDHCKTQDLLAAGFVVVRLREDNLPSLAIDHPRYRELRVYSAAPRPHVVMEEVHDWVAGLAAR